MQAYVSLNRPKRRLCAMVLSQDGDCTVYISKRPALPGTVQINEDGAKDCPQLDIADVEQHCGRGDASEEWTEVYEGDALTIQF